ncbi:CocE/NonD family hydrolase [Colwellia piezophila]|uniref:CocE/NonD family hydrolase n=1 Tax=Colwellia piezophila TaxID=211668 RepID=UPI000382CB53|nr:CocE/NonD family hydrolase [Colwellia piezophila]
MTTTAKISGHFIPQVSQYFSLILGLTLLLTLISVQADEKPPKTFTTPNLLSQASIKNSDDALLLLNQDKFHQQLIMLTEQLSAETINQENTFNKVALLSILGKHKTLLELVNAHKNGINFSHYILDSETQLTLNNKKQDEFTETLAHSLRRLLANKDDEALYQLNSALGWSVSGAQDYVFNVFQRYQKLPTLNASQAIDLIVNSHLYRVLARVIPVSQKLLSDENNSRYIIEADTLIRTPNGIELSATIVRKKHSKNKLPSAMQFTIYADEAGHINTAIHAAAHGYVGIIVNSRGKRSSSNVVVPWEHDGEDATSAIDWISKQSWSNGDVVMYGGSYNGFTQWAAAKHMHPALKAMAPYTAASLITGLPYENNIALTGNYEWAFFATNNKTVDNSVYSNWKKSNQLVTTLFESGQALQDIDKIDGKANPWFQKWLQHPSFDSYYQAMVPYKTEYANINIPVLSVTGYFDGGQISSLDYLKRHNKYNKNANHTLLIGPYNHSTAQGIPRSHHSNYELDQVALEKDTEEIVFQWFDHLLLNTEKPKLLQDTINYQLMGSNQWRHAKSLTALNEQSTTFYLASTKNSNGYYSLLKQAETKETYVAQTVDMADRTTEHNKAPWPVIQNKLAESNGLIYVTETFEQPQELAGAITGHFEISVNKQDVDIGYNFYEMDADGKVFHLNNYRSRASFANDMSERHLLTANKKTIIPIINARMTAKLIKQGSRLVIVLNVNKNKDAQVNMGSGKAVNEETSADAKEPLNIKWYSGSEINIPLKPWQG